MDLLVLVAQHLKMAHDRFAQPGQPHRAEPAGLGMDHVFELVAAAGEFGQRLAGVVCRQLDVTGLAAAHLVRGGGIGRQQPGIRGVGLGVDADQLAVSGEARRMDDLDGKLRLTQRLHQRLLMAAGGLHHDAGHVRPRAQPFDQRDNGIGSVGVMGAPAPVPCHVEAGAAHVDADERIVR